jgi:hypothetical protein
MSKKMSPEEATQVRIIGSKFNGWNEEITSLGLHFHSFYMQMA